MWIVYFWDVCLIFWTALDCRQLELWKATSPSRKDHCTFKCHSKVGDRKHRFPRNVENVPNYFSGRDIFYFSHRIKLMKGKWNQDLTLSFLFFSCVFLSLPLIFSPYVYHSLYNRPPLWQLHRQFVSFWDQIKSVLKN